VTRADRAPDRSVTIARTVGRNTLSMAALRFTVLGVWFAVTPRVLAALGPERFGFWSILLAFGGSLAALDLGLGVAVTRAVARLQHAGGRAALTSMLRRAALLQGLVACLLGGVALALAPALLHLFKVPTAWLAEARLALVLAVGAFVLSTLSNLFLAGLQGLQRMDKAVPFAVPAALGLGAAVLWGTRRAQPLVALTAVQLAYAGVTLLAYALVLARMVRRDVDEASAVPAVADRGVALGELLRLGGWVQVNSLLALLQAQVDKFILGALVALAPVASYELGARVTAAVMIPPLIFVGSLLPAFSRAAAEDSRAGMLALYRAALDPHFALTLGIAGAVIALAPWILAAWLGTPPPGALACLVALAVAQTGYAVTGVASTVVRARGDLRLEFLYAILATGLHVALSIVGLRLAGLLGLLVGTAVSSVVALIWYVQRVDASLEPDAPGRVWMHLWPFLVAAMAAGGVALGVAILVHPAHVDRSAWWGLLAGGVAYALAYAGTLRLAFRPKWTALRDRGRRLGPAGA